MPKVIALLLALSALGLSACDDPPKEQQRVEAASETVVTEARKAAEENVRIRLRILGEM
jgi:starvation-inducible outer membrane lipoprotein